MVKTVQINIVSIVSKTPPIQPLHIWVGTTGQVCVGALATFLYPWGNQHFPIGGRDESLCIPHHSDFPWAFTPALHPPPWQQRCGEMSHANKMTQEQGGLKSGEGLVRKGSITAFPGLVTEDQGSWVALETEIEGVLRGFTCWFWMPCFNLKWLAVSLKALRKLTPVFKKASGEA